MSLLGHREDAEDAWDAFVSHSSRDKDRVRELVAALRARGVTLWFDEEQIQAGDSIPLKVEGGIENSETVIVCLSENFLRSQWTPSERAAFSYDDPQNRRPILIPVLFEDCPVPRALRHLRMVDYEVHNEDAISEILAAISRARRNAPVVRDGHHALIGLPQLKATVENIDEIADPSEELNLSQLRAVAAIRETLRDALTRSRGLHKSLIVLDLDRFTQINRVFGDHAADLVIAEVQERVNVWCEEIVKAGPVAGLAQWRGMDEWFVVVASSAFLATNELSELASQLLSRIRQIDCSQIASDLFVSASAGVVCQEANKASDPALDLLRRGLAGLRRAKRESPGAAQIGPRAIQPVASVNAGLTLAAHELSDLDTLVSISDHEKWEPKRSSATFYGTLARA